MAEKEIQVLSCQEKAKLLAIIADIKFVNISEADLYRCNKCNSIAIFHYVASCHHVLCGKCHGQYYNKSCPVENCKSTTINEIVQNLEFEFGLNNLEVYCRFKDNGCDAIVKLSNLLIHHSTCKFTINNLLPRLWVPDRLTNLEGTIAILKKENNDISKKVTENQEKVCREIMKVKKTIKEMGQQINSRLNLFEDAKKQSQVEETIASLSIEINDISKIIKEDQEKVRREISERKKTINEMGQQMNSMLHLFEDAKMQIQEMKNHINTSYKFFWKVFNFCKMKIGEKHEITAEFVSNDAKYKIFIRLCKSDSFTFISTSCAPCEAKCYDLLYPHHTTLCILNQFSCEPLKHICRVNDSRFHTDKINQLSIVNSAIKKNYLKNDSIVIKIIIEPFLNNYKYLANYRNGSMIWKIDNYANRKQDIITGITDGIFSDYFLSSEEGYRMKLELGFYCEMLTYINVVFVHGEYDCILEMKFPHNTTFTIIDQSDSEKKKHLIKTKENEMANYDCVDFDITELENSKYLKNDCIILKVTVERT